MNSGFKSQCVPQYRLLTEEQIGEIHRAALEVLETAGVRLLDDEAVQMAAGAGCRVRDGNVVLMPGWLVEAALSSAPKRITVYSRDGQEAMRLEGRNAYFGLGTDLVQTVDLVTGESRPTKLSDVANATRVADYLPDVDFVASFGLPRDVPTQSMYVECARAMVSNSAKPIFFTAAGAEDLSIIIEMAALVAGGSGELRDRPFLIHYSEPTSPLTHSHGALRKLFLCAEKGVPICYTPGVLLGASAPVTLAGGIVQCTAEAVSGIVLHQLRAKGAPIVSGFGLGPLDLREGTMCYGSPEERLTNSAFADIFHSYGLPMWSIVGTDAHCLDAQAAMEHAFGTLLAAMDGANLIHDIGYLGQGLLANPASIVMSAEIVGYVKRFLRGFDLSRDKMALETIRLVGPGGHYLTAPHTRDHFREEIWQPPNLNRKSPRAWAKAGKARYEQVVTQKAIEILNTHRPRPLSDEIRRGLDEIAARAERDLAGIEFVS